MSPVGKPTSDGDVVLGSRHYSGKPNPLGVVGVWQCPACGKQNDGQKVEHGCVHCGAGDQRKGTAGKVGADGQLVGPPAIEIDARDNHAKFAYHPGAAHPDDRYHRGHPGLGEAYRPQPSASHPSTAPQTRILRLVEYLVSPGKDATLTLRNSLVGRMAFDWGTLTATIVDSLDARQEDLLNLARRQPGVWLGNPEAMKADRVVGFNRRVDTTPRQRREMERMTPPDPGTPPDTGPAFTRDHEILAQAIEQHPLGGFKLCYTLALALQSIAEELRMNSEPEKFLTTDEALRLAAALLAQVPDDWTGEAAETAAPPPPVPDPANADRRQQIRDRLREAAVPKPVFRDVPPDETGSTR